MTEPMSQRRYRKEGGAHCPFCRSDAIEGGSIEIGNGLAIQEMGCNDCGKAWADTYHLHHYTEIE